MGYFSLKISWPCLPCAAFSVLVRLTAAHVCCSGHGDKEEYHGVLINLASVAVAEGAERVEEREVGRK